MDKIEKLIIELLKIKFEGIKKAGRKAEDYSPDQPVLQEIQDRSFEIEYTESNKLKELTPNGKIAVKIVTEIGNLWE